MKRFGFGTMRLPLKDANDKTSIDLETMKKMVDIFNHMTSLNDRGNELE